MTHREIVKSYLVIHIVLIVTLVFASGCGISDLNNQTTSKMQCNDSSLLHSFDFEVQITSLLDDEIHEQAVWLYRKSGKNYHGVTVNDGEIYEITRIDGKPTGRRISGEDWEEDWEMDGDIPHRVYGFPYVLDTICPDTSNLKAISTTVIDGTPLTRYASPDGDYSSEFEKWEHLINSEGRLIQSEDIENTPYKNAVISKVVKFSGFGEANVIVDPFLNITPVPSPTPGPSPTPEASSTPTATTVPTATPTSTATSIPGTPPPLFPTVADAVLPTPTPRIVVMAQILLPTPSPIPTPTVTSTPTHTPTPTITPSPTNTPTATPTPTPAPNPKISRIERSIRSVTLGNGDTVQLSVGVYGRQNIRDDSLGNNVSFDWSVTSGGGSFREVDSGADSDSIPDERNVLFVASGYGNHTVTVSLDPWECVGGCSASFGVRIRR